MEQRGLPDLPAELQARIFGFLTHEEVSTVRCVCRALAAAANRYLRASFQRLQPALDGQLRRARDPAAGRLTDKHVARCHALCLAAVEYRLLRAVCWRYMCQETRLFFFPGRLLDIFYRIVHMTNEDPAKERSPKYYSILLEMVYALTRLMETFIGFYECRLEPALLPSAAHFGVKFIDLLDCFLGHVCKFSVGFGETECNLVGRYQCPLSGYLNCPRGAALRRIHPCSKAEVSAWLKDLRELVRKSNQQFVEDLLKSFRMDDSQRRKLSLFAGCSGSKAHPPGGATYWRKMEAGAGPSFGHAYLCAKIEARLPADQLPLELRCEGAGGGTLPPDAAAGRGFLLRCEVCLPDAEQGHVIIFKPSYCLHENRCFVNFTGVISSENELPDKIDTAIIPQLDTSVQRKATSKT
ncbi:uncharacterized protein LOC134534538 [Bacillus rossius redtenbacheri]|uniref:uncharacterized protein LOC134534538 n=1 Tax=Bacillus rossius redtenbacheri TaxID=93214 RepID=UPI002FDC8C2E